MSLSPCVDTRDAKQQSPSVANLMTSNNPPWSEDQELTVKNTFLHIIDQEDLQQNDPRVMTRIYSAPTPECSGLSSKKFRSDEPVKVTRITGLQPNCMPENELWDGTATSCLLETADGSSVECSWSTQSKSGELPPVRPDGVCAPTTELIKFGLTTQQLRENAEMNGSKEFMPPSNSLCAIQEMFSNMNLTASHEISNRALKNFTANREISVKNSFLEFKGDVDDEFDTQDRMLQKYSSAPDALNSRVMPPKGQALPSLSEAEALAGEEVEEETTRPMHSPATPTGVSAEQQCVDFNISDKRADPVPTSSTPVKLPRPWDTNTLVAMPTIANRAPPAPGTKFLCTFVVGIRECRQFAVSRRVIGPRGDNMKFISTLCAGTKLRLRGKGSGFRERDTNAESNVSLQINVSSPDLKEYELAKRELSSLLTSIYCDYKQLCGKNVRLKILEHPKNPKA